VAFFIFSISIYIGPYYILGDQIPYKSVYNALPSLDFFNGFIYYKNNLSSIEPIYYIITWIFSRILEKDILMSFVNAVFAFYSFRLFVKWKASVYIAGIITLTNFYFYVFYFAADRLKFGFLFIAIALYNIENKRFFIYSFLSLMSHAQLFIIYISFVFNEFLIEVRRVFLFGKIKIVFLFSLILLIFILFLLYNQISEKTIAYLSIKNGFYISDVFKLFAFLILTLFYSKKRF
jgi:hypothetical protein